MSDSNNDDHRPERPARHVLSGPPWELPEGPPIHGRYVDLGLLGAGGEGEVRRVYDPVLQRSVAMKIHPLSADAEETIARFRAEARISARLTHPAIIAIHDWGILQDGRPFIVMPIVSGQTLAGVIQEAYRRGPPDIHVLKRLVAMVRTTCEAIAYAHSRGVIHRDIKPGNIMVGDFGEVIVLDWGLARRKGSPIEELAAAPTVEDDVSITVTRTGEIKGSLGYMAPEQARGEVWDIDERTDVFALGAVLFEVLCAAPLWGRSPREALAAAQEGRRIRVTRRPGLPRALIDICERATHPEPEARYRSAADLARAVGDWVDGLNDLLRARALIVKADHAREDARRCQRQARAHEQRAAALLSGVDPTAEEDARLAGWQQEDIAKRLRSEAEMLEFQRIQHLQAALSHAPELPEAHERLASHYYDQHRAARDPAIAARLELRLRQHDRGQYAAYLKGTGRVSLAASRPATVQVFAYRPHRRRLKPEPLGPPAPAPLVRRELPIGSYLITLTTEDGVAVRYPLSITRCGHATTAPHPGMPAAPVWIPDAVPDGMVYVPAGAFWCGGDSQAFGLPLALQRVWVDGFFIARHHVTNADYIAFLDDLVDRGFEEAALACCPRERGGGGKLGREVYGRTEAGHFELVPDHDGDLWDPQWPVLMVPFAAMQAYAAWMSERTGLLHRLPYELEWEKAARGGDQRVHVWGTDAYDRTWCQVGLTGGSGRSSPASVGFRTVDVSPYGVCDLAGNATDVCLDHYTRDGPVIEDGRWQPRTEPTGLRTVRGGHWAAHFNKARLCWRGGGEEGSRSALNSFRLVIPVGPGGPKRIPDQSK